MLPPCLRPCRAVTAAVSSHTCKVTDNYCFSFGRTDIYEEIIDRKFAKYPDMRVVTITCKRSENFVTYVRALIPYMTRFENSFLGAPRDHRAAMHMRKAAVYQKTHRLKCARSVEIITDACSSMWPMRSVECLSSSTQYHPHPITRVYSASIVADVTLFARRIARLTKKDLIQCPVDMPSLEEIHYNQGVLLITAAPRVLTQRYGEFNAHVSTSRLRDVNQHVLDRIPSDTLVRIITVPHNRILDAPVASDRSDSEDLSGYSSDESYW
jgi:hypothetical protein